MARNRGNDHLPPTPPPPPVQDTASDLQTRGQRAAGAPRSKGAVSGALKEERGPCPGRRPWHGGCAPLSALPGPAVQGMTGGAARSRRSVE